jgi:dCMP deaminase
MTEEQARNREYKWHNRFINLAEHIASWSKDPSTKTGAVIVDSDNRVVSMGYNGFSKGVRDTLERLTDREIKYKIIVHCERNAIMFARQSLVGCRLYTWPFMSCAACAAMVIQTGITQVIAPKSDNPRWIDDFILAQEIFTEAGIEVLLL